MINVKNGEFYGPFDLLLELIRKSKYDIYDVKLSEITNDYLNNIKVMDIPVDETADFILIATQLLYIKTKSLIKDTIDIDEEDMVSEDELLRRLQEYKKIKSVIQILRDFENEGNLKFTKLQEDLSKYKKDEDKIVLDISVLTQSLELLLNDRFSNDEFQVEKILNIEEYSLEKYSNDIKLKLIRKKILNITSMLNKVHNKSEAIIIFLSILELSKIRNINIFQDNELNIEIRINDDLERSNNEW